MFFRILFILFALPLILAAGNIDIVKNGKPCAVIVIDKKAPRMVQYAAKELRDYIKKTGGAELQIVHAPVRDKTSVFVGESAGTKKLGINVKKLSADGFIVKAVKNGLVLCGRDYAGKQMAGVSHPFRLKQSYNAKLGINRYGETGTLYAVYSFLEKFCGIRWFMPGELGEVVPTNKNISLSDKTFYSKAPDFQYRFLWNCDFPVHAEGTLWYRRAGFGAAYPVNIQHSFKRLRKYRDTHPEYLALYQGKRDYNLSCQGDGNLCLSNPGLFKAFVKEARDFFDADPSQKMFPVMPNDSFEQICECADCQKQIDHASERGRFSNYVWGFVNKVAAEVKKTHPDKIISCCAYGRYYLVPDKIKKLEDNVAVMICRHVMFYGTKSRKEADDKIIASWRKIMAPGRLYFWEYFNLAETMPFYRNVPVPITRIFAAECKKLNGICGGMFIESPHFNREKKIQTPGLYHLNWYMAARMMWDANADIEALLKDYYTKFYGPAAKDMQNFWERCEKIWSTNTPDRNNDLYRKLYNLSNVTEIFGYLDAARKKTKKGSIYRRRVEMIQKEIAPLMPRVKNNLVTGKPDGKCFKVAQSPVLDGVITKGECWNSLPVYKFVSPAGEAIADGTDAQFAFDDKNIYCYFKFAASQADRFGFKADCREQDSPTKPYIWDDDSVEMFFNFEPENKNKLYQIIINAAGTVFDLDYGKNRTKWNSRVKTVIKKHQFAWSVEMAIPLASFGLTGKNLNNRKITANFVRNHVDGNVMRRSSWSPTLNGHNNNIKAFAPFTFSTGGSFESLPVDFKQAYSAFDKAKAGDCDSYEKAGKRLAKCTEKYAKNKELFLKSLYTQTLCQYWEGDIKSAFRNSKKLLAFIQDNAFSSALKAIEARPEKSGKIKVPAKDAVLFRMLYGFASSHIEAAKLSRQLQGKYQIKVKAFSASEPWRFTAMVLALSAQEAAVDIKLVTAKAAQAQCAANLKNLGVLFFIYAQKNNGRFPRPLVKKPKALWFDQIHKAAGLRTKKLPYCPAIKKGYGIGINNIFMGLQTIPKGSLLLAADSVHYQPGNYPHKPSYSGAAYKISVVMEHSGTGTVDRDRHFGGANVLFCDGTVKWLASQEFTGHIWRR